MDASNRIEKAAGSIDPYDSAAWEAFWDVELRIQCREYSKALNRFIALPKPLQGDVIGYNKGRAVKVWKK